MNKYFRWGLLGFFTLAFVGMFLPFYSEILMAAIFAFALDPLTRRMATTPLSKKYSVYFKRKSWVAITLIGMFMLISLPITFAVYNIYAAINAAAADGFQNTAFYKDLLRIKALGIESADHLTTALNLNRKVDLVAIGDRVLQELGQSVMAYSGKFLSTLPEFGVFLFVFSCALYYFLAENKQIRAFVLRTELIREVELQRVTVIFQKASATTLFASMITGFIQAAVVAVGSAIFDIGDFFVIFVITFFLSFIPVVGAAPVALLLGLIGLINQNYGAAIGLLVVAIIAGSIDNIVRPMLAGGEEDIHPVVVLLGIIGAIIIFGLPGLFLGPVITSATVKLYRAYILDSQPPDAP